MAIVNLYEREKDMKKTFVVKTIIVSVCAVIAIVSALLVCPLLTRTERKTTSHCRYPLYRNLDDLLANSEAVIYARVLSVEDAKWTPYGPEENTPYVITTDFVIEILDEYGASHGTTILREYGGTVGNSKWTTASDTDLLSVFQIGNTYVLCVMEYPERSGGVTYTVNGHEQTYSSCYKLTSGPDSVFLASSNGMPGTSALSNAVQIRSMTGRYENVDMSCFDISIGKEEK